LTRTVRFPVAKSQELLGKFHWKKKGLSVVAGMIFAT